MDGAAAWPLRTELSRRRQQLVLSLDSRELTGRQEESKGGEVL
jgi:hypothetical protein